MDETEEIRSRSKPGENLSSELQKLKRNIDKIAEFYPDEAWVQKSQRQMNVCLDAQRKRENWFTDTLDDIAALLQRITNKRLRPNVMAFVERTEDENAARKLKEWFGW